MRLFLAAILLFAASSTASAQTDSPPSNTTRRFMDEVDALFRPVTAGSSPGAVVGIIRNQQVVLAKGYGMANVETQTPLTASTKLRIGSVTKTFTAIAVLQLVEAGKLRLDDPLSRFAPEIPDAGAIRIAQLLSHTSGIPDFIPLEEVRKRPLEFAPGMRINYSNNGYQLLGRIIEKVSGLSWEDYLRQHIFLPAGMTNSGLDRSLNLPGRAAGYLPGKEGSYLPVLIESAEGAYAAGGLYSTVEDMLRWIQALDSGKLLSRAMLQRATGPGVTSDGRKTVYGLGWMTKEVRGLRRYGHGGDIPGFNAYVAQFPDENFTVVVLANIGMRPPGPLPDAGALAHRIAEIWLMDRMQPNGPPPSFPVAVSTLRSYTGRYKIHAPEVILRNMGADIVVVLEGERLSAEANGIKIPLHPTSDTHFELSGSPAELTFVPGAGSKCPKVVITLMGLREYDALREEPPSGH
jgi:D-alanyl-D-alanine carboxypeptidase